MDSAPGDHFDRWLPERSGDARFGRTRKVSQALKIMAAMCAMCDGATHEEFLADTHERIQRFGFTVLGVEAEPGVEPWLYTVGLVEHHDHPELYLTGVPVGFAGALLNHWSRYIIKGHRLAPGETALAGGICFADGETTFVGDLYFHIGEVDDSLWDGDTFNQWKQYYRWRGGIRPEPAAVELIVCGNQPAVTAPAGLGRPNRAARRAQARRRHLR